MKVSEVIKQGCGVAAEVLRSRGLILAAALLLPYAGVLAGLDIAARYGEWTGARLPEQFFLSTDEGLGEYYEYAMTAAASLLLLLLWRADRQSPYLTNALLFAWLTLDNAVQLHEEGGALIAPLFASLGFIPVAPNQIGEAFLLIVIAVIWLGSLLRSLRSSNLRPVIHSLLLAVCIAGTAAFGVIVDFVDSWGTHPLLERLLGDFVEDGGEFGMIVLSLIVTVAIYDSERQRRAIG